jgi:hypothetical protein
MAVERMRSSGNIGDLAKELGVGRRCLYKWQAKLDHLEPGALFLPRRTYRALAEPGAMGMKTAVSIPDDVFEG